MKLNKKGFTLIELLAVIVILAIILLIATPVILGVVEKARENAARSSAMGYVNALEKEIIIRELQDEESIYDIVISDTNFINLRGDKPSSVSISISNGNIHSGTIQFGDYVFTVDGGNVAKATTEG